MTIIEDICGASVNTDTVLHVDWWMVNDGISKDVPILMRGRKPVNPGSVKVFIDHEAPCGSEISAEFQKRLIQMAMDDDCQLYNGCGVSYQLMLDEHVRKRDIVASCGDFNSIFGAQGALGIKLSPVQMAESLISGTVNFTVPETVAILVKTPPQSPADAKDLAMAILKKAGDAIRGKSLELTGAGVSSLSDSERLKLFQMLGCTGATAAFYSENANAPIFMCVDGGNLKPVAAPADNMAECKEVNDCRGLAVSAVFIGGCSCGRIEDLRLAADLAKGRQISRAVRATVAPVSAEVFKQAADEGLIGDLMDAGFVVMNQGCGGCYAKSQGMVDDRDVVLSTGSRACFCCTGGNVVTYLCSVRTAVIGALCGTVTEEKGEA